MSVARSCLLVCDLLFRPLTLLSCFFREGRVASWPHEAVLCPDSVGLRRLFSWFSCLLCSLLFQVAVTSLTMFPTTPVHLKLSFKYATFLWPGLRTQPSKPVVGVQNAAKWALSKGQGAPPRDCHA